MQYNAGVQRELPWNSIIDVNFLYSRTNREFIRDVDVATFFPGNGALIRQGDGSFPTNTITCVTSDGYARYKALTAKWDKRFAKRFQYTASYALSRLNITSTDGLGLGGGALVNRNNAGNYGLGGLGSNKSPDDERHRGVPLWHSFLIALNALEWSAAVHHNPF